jgi:nanoRNase/pAp phosphatase (c-di-AMP/oligoRNAs hydrolase)
MGKRPAGRLETDGMLERFTDRARKVMALANQEAQRFNHEYIGTEHVLLGLVKEGSGVAANALKSLGLDLRKVRQEVEKLCKSGPDYELRGNLPQTPRVKKAIEYAIEEARNLNHNYVGTEHLLLGLIREQEGVAARVLCNLGLDLEDVQLATRKILSPDLAVDSCRAVSDQLGSGRRVLIVTHVRPDGDALGTAAAMALGLREKGIDFRVMLFDPIPAKYAFVMEEERIPWFDCSKDWPADTPLESFDTLLVVDTGTWSQLPRLREKLQGWKGKKLVIDHHLTQENWADVKLVDTEAAAAGEIAAQLLRLWRVKLSGGIATALYFAIATDTGWFQFSNTRPQTLRLAAELLAVGVDADRLYRAAYQNERPQRLALMARALQGLELLAGGRLAVMTLSKTDFQQTGADNGDTENLVNIPMQVGSVEVSILLSEQPDNAPVRANLRGKGTVDLAAFAQQFGGGGHARAAGTKMKMDMAEARKVIVEAMVGELMKREDVKT